MIQSIKNSIKKIIRLSGKTFQPINSYQESLELVKYDWLKNKNIKTIFDRRK